MLLTACATMQNPCDSPQKTIAALAGQDPQSAMARREELRVCGESFWIGCRELIQNGTEQEQVECYFLLSEHADWQDVPLLAKGLSSPSVSVRIAATTALSAFPKPLIQAELESAIETETNPSLRVLLTQLAIYVADPALLPSLELRFGTLPNHERNLLTPYGRLESVLQQARTRLATSSP